MFHDRAMTARSAKAVEVRPRPVELNFKSAELRRLFEENAIECTSSPELSAREIAVKKDLASLAGNNTTTDGANTQITKHQKNKEKAAYLRKVHAGNEMAKTFGAPLEINRNEHLEKIELADKKIVGINRQGYLMVRGEGPEFEFRQASLDEKIQLEENSQQCSVAITQEEIEMNAYFRGETDVIPESLQAMAYEAHSKDPTLGLANPTREQLAGLVKDKYEATAPHISDRILDKAPLTSGTLSLDNLGTDFLPPSPDASTEPVSQNLQTKFFGATTPDNMSPVPNQLPSLTPLISAPTPMG